MPTQSSTDSHKGYFISYAYTGVPAEHIEQGAGAIYQIISGEDIKVFYSNTDDNNKIFKNEYNRDTEKIYQHCLKEQKNYSKLIGVIIANKKSDGMEMELAQAIADNQPYHLFIHEDYKSREDTEWIDKYFEYAKKSGSVSYIARGVDNIVTLTGNIIQRSKSK